jgi:SAM-dependent methyltransferase
MLEKLEIAEIQERLMQYAGFKKELKAKYDRQKFTLLSVAAEESQEKIKVSIQEIYGGTPTFLASLAASQVSEFEVSSLDEAAAFQSKIDAIDIETKGAVPKIFNGMQNLLDRNPDVTIHFSFNSSEIQKAGFNPKSFAYNLLNMGFSLTKNDSYSQISSVSEAELLSGNTIKLTLKRVIHRGFLAIGKDRVASSISIEMKPINFEKPIVVKAPSSNFNRYHSEIPNPQKQGGVPQSPESQEKVVQGLLQLGIEVENYQVDIQEYRQYFQDARYLQDFPDYYSFNLPEKTLEHYIAAKLLQLNNEDIYIDIASQHSPTPEIYHRLFGVQAYLQDLDYPQGLHGNQIGGDAANMPVPDGFATKMALHCSFEHFENGSDMGFIRELSRVLQPGGAVCITPFYLFDEFAVQTDPAVSIPQGVKFDEDATVYCAYGWGNRHGRFYDPARVFSRVCKNLNGMKMKVYRIINAQQVDPSCYVQFAALISKPLQGESISSREKYDRDLMLSGIIA